MPFIISKHMKRVLHHSSCFSTYMKTITVVDPRDTYITIYTCVLHVYGLEGILIVFNHIHTLLGIHHYINITFCHCEEETTTLIRYHLWPASPTRPVMAFAFDLLDRCESLLLECQVALSNFVALLKVSLPWYEQLRLDHVSINHTI